MSRDVGRGQEMSSDTVGVGTGCGTKPRGHILGGCGRAVAGLGLREAPPPACRCCAVAGRPGREAGMAPGPPLCSCVHLCASGPDWGACLPEGRTRLPTSLAGGLE